MNITNLSLLVLLSIAYPVAAGKHHGEHSPSTVHTITLFNNTDDSFDVSLTYTQYNLKTTTNKEETTPFTTIERHKKAKIQLDFGNYENISAITIRKSNIEASSTTQATTKNLTRSKYTQISLTKENGDFNTLGYKITISKNNNRYVATAGKPKKK